MSQEQEKFISKEECHELAKAMTSKYKIALKGRLFEISAEKTDDRVQVQVLFKSLDESFYYPVDARILFEQEEMTANEAVLFLVDYIDVYFEEFLLEEDEALYLPIDWQDFEYEAVNFQMKGQIFNRKLDGMADKLLADAGLSL